MALLAAGFPAGQNNKRRPTYATCLDWLMDKGVRIGIKPCTQKSEREVYEASCVFEGWLIETVAEDWFAAMNGLLIKTAQTILEMSKGDD